MMNDLGGVYRLTPDLRTCVRIIILGINLWIYPANPEESTDVYQFLDSK